MADPSLTAESRRSLVTALMTARRAVGAALRSGDREAERAARDQVDAAKRALGERGPPWWTDGALDWNRKLVRNTPYAAWWRDLEHTGC